MFDDMQMWTDEEFIRNVRACLTGKDWKAIARKGVGAGATYLISGARKSLQKVTNRAKSRRTNAAHGWYAKKKNGVILGFRSLQEGIRSKNHIEDWENIYRKINILHDFRLKFFETGTNDRYVLGNGREKFRDVRRKNNHQSTNKKAFRGHMTATYFFEKSLNQNRSEANRRVRQNIEKNLYKLKEKYKM